MVDDPREFDKATDDEPEDDAEDVDGEGDGSPTTPWMNMLGPSAFDLVGQSWARFSFPALPKIPDYDALIPKIDLGLPDYSAILPKLDLQLPQWDFIPKLPTISAFPTIIDQFAAFQIPTTTWQIATLLGETGARLTELIRSITAAALPPNWADLEKTPFDDLNALAVDEGIPVMWVPRAATLQALLDADGPAARRRIIGQRWRGISADCMEVLDGIETPRLRERAGFASRAVQALRDGHSDAAQALTANLLDTLVFDPHLANHRTKIRGNKLHKGGPKFNPDDFRFKEGLTFAPIFHAHVHFEPKNGDPVPWFFARHASAHAVCRRQYSRVNTVFAVLMVTSLLRFVDDDL